MPSQINERICPKSSLGECLSSWIKGEGNLLIAMEAYFDGSWDCKDMSRASYVTLAGIATSDSIWAEFDAGWQTILGGEGLRPYAPYLHMRELRSGTGPFHYTKGWNLKRCAELAVRLLMYMQDFDKERFRMAVCTLDMKAYREVLKNHRLPSPEEICNEFCPHILLEWYWRYYPDLMDTAHFFFDIDEPFKRYFEATWELEKRARFEIVHHAHIWDMVATVTTADSKKKPSLQAADLVAWSHNRELFAEEGEFAKYFAHIQRQIIPFYKAFVSEQSIRSRYT